MGERATTSEIRRHPLRPEGFEEPLFLGRAAKKEIAEHIRESASWLRKASEARVRGPAGEPCHVLERPDGSAYLVRVQPKGAGCRRRRWGVRARKRRVRGVIERWREVGGWWRPDGGTHRLCFRVLLGGAGEAGEAAVDLAFDRSGPKAGSWSLVRVLD
ncbi:hypothetical protein [Rubrobacter marinus]|uniref:hypothetical protein n=1 Tax=Rubrobacter marinus TaxID=2653852 RepID=UPI001408A496|nr:hypothetical protein [Rubrobacter marinus]